MLPRSLRMYKMSDRTYAAPCPYTCNGTMIFEPLKCHIFCSTCCVEANISKPETRAQIAENFMDRDTAYWPEFFQCVLPNQEELNAHLDRKKSEEIRSRLLDIQPLPYAAFLEQSLITVRGKVLILGFYRNGAVGQAYIMGHLKEVSDAFLKAYPELERVDVVTLDSDPPATPSAPV